MKLGIIGLDSSHAVQFSRILNGEREPFHIGGHPAVSYTHLESCILYESLWGDDGNGWD